MTAGADRYERRASAGPMQIASSASWTGSESRSASLYATTASAPSVRQARRIAERDLAAVGDEDLAEHGQASGGRGGGELDEDEVLAVFDRVARLDEAGPDHAVRRRDDLLRDAEHVDRAEPVAGPHLGPGTRLRSRLEDADRRRGRHDAAVVADPAVAAVAVVASAGAVASRGFAAVAAGPDRGQAGRLV